MLLAAVCLLVGQSAWADDVYSFTEGKWTEEEAVNWALTTGTASVSTCTVNDSKNLYFLSKNTSNSNHSEEYYFTRSIETTGTDTKLTLSANWFPGGASGGNKRIASLAFGDIAFKFQGQEGICYVSIGGVDTQLGNKSTDWRDKGWTISATINQTTKVITYNITINGSNFTGYKKIDGDLSAYTSIVIGLSGEVNWAMSQTLKALTISEETASSTSHTYTINAVDDNSTKIQTISSSTAIEDDICNVYIPKCVKDGSGKFYVLDDASNANLSEYKASYLMSTTDATKEIKYTLDESIVGFLESGTNVTQDKSNLSNLSSGNSAHVNSGKTSSIATVGAGIYSFEAYLYERGDRGLYLRDGGNSDASSNIIVNQSVNRNSAAGLYKINFTLDSEKSLSLSGFTTSGDKPSYNQSAGFDYVIIRKISDATGEIVGDVNYTTNYFNAWNTLPIWINAGETAYYKFVNYNNTASANLYENWYLFGATEASENVVIFGPNHSNTATNATYSSKPTFTMADLNGATVELTTTLTKDGETYTLTTTGVTTKADGTTLSPNLVYTQTGLTSSKLKLYVSVEKSWLELLEQAVKKPIGTYGYATFSSTNAVNVDVEGLEAYVVTGKNENGSSITTEKITGDVAANTGLILKGNAGTYSLPVVTSGTTYDKSSEPKNYLFACDGTRSTVDAAEEGTNYVLSVQSDKVVFAPIGTTPAPVKAGQAALWLQETGNAKALALSFGDDVTGIDAVSTVEPQGSKTYYNLQGQRVSEPKQGIYVVDGKKVLVK